MEWPVVQISYHMAVILNWRCLRLNSWPDCVFNSRDITRHGSNSYIFGSRGRCWIS